MRDAFLGLGTSAWLGYTYLYPTLSVAHSTLPACPFLLLTGHPCPFCGGTRSFSSMWRGDLIHAARLYPFGPLLFLLAFPVAAYGLWALTSGRSVSVVLRPSLMKALTVIGVLALATSWSLKLLWLGN
jgi:uncharacterized protein DUF2752